MFLCFAEWVRRGNISPTIATTPHSPLLTHCCCPALTSLLWSNNVSSLRSAIILSTFEWICSVSTQTLGLIGSVMLSGFSSGMRGRKKLFIHFAHRHIRAQWHRFHADLALDYQRNFELLFNNISPTVSCFFERVFCINPEQLQLNTDFVVWRWHDNSSMVGTTKNHSPDEFMAKNIDGSEM